MAGKSSEHLGPHLGILSKMLHGEILPKSPESKVFPLLQHENQLVSNKEIKMSVVLFYKKRLRSFEGIYCTV